MSATSQCGNASQELKTGAVYALFDPRNPRVPKYIGLTRTSLRQRLYSHLVWSYRNQSHPLSIWLRSLDESGVIPTITALEVVPLRELQLRETHWIRFYRPLGSLLNKSDGPGMLGLSGTVSELNRQITRARNRKGWTEQTRAKIVAGLSKAWTQERKEEWKNSPRFAAFKQNAIIRNKTADRSKWNRPKTRPFSHTPEITLAKRRANPKLVEHSKVLAAFNEQRKKAVVSVESGRVFHSVNEAVKTLGVTRQAFANCMKHGWRVKGEHWKFKEQICQPQ